MQRVEREARELGLDEVRAVLHHDLELAVALGALPLGDEVEHVDLREKRDKISGGWASVLYKQRIFLRMPITNDEEAFAAICSLLNIEQIYEIILVSDDQIRSVCSVELAQLLIKLKEDTIKEFLNRLA